MISFNVNNSQKINSIISTQTKISQSFLDLEQRPKEIQNKISEVFKKINQNSESEWGIYNGDYKYNLCSIDERQLMRTIIQSAPPEQKDFYVLDIGAGNFQWGQGLANFINSQNDLHQDITVHIISVRGESFAGDPLKSFKLCKLYNLGNFKIEELSLEFKKLNISIENSLDLVVTRWCLTHLVDGVGTFIQIISLLRPKTGFLFGDGFYFFYENDKCEDNDFGKSNENMIQLLLDARVPFLMQDYDVDYSLNRFVLRRQTDQLCKLPMSYLSMDKFGSDSDMGSNSIVRFKRTCEEAAKREREINWPLPCAFHGDKDLYDWFKQHALLPQPNTFQRKHVTNFAEWQPILNSFE